MNWFFRRILSGIAFGIGFVISVVLISVAFQQYNVYAKKNNIQILPNMAETKTAATTTQEEVPEDLGAEKIYRIYDKGYNYRYGHGVNKNNTEAAKLFQQAADLGHVKAMEELAYMYREGFGVQVDYKKSFDLFTKAAEQKSLYAEESIGRAYLEGYYVPINYEQAFKHYTIAAEGGRGYAMGQLGWMYEKGLYVERSHILSKQWYEKGKANGDDYSTQRINEGW